MWGIYASSIFPPEPSSEEYSFSWAHVIAIATGLLGDILCKLAFMQSGSGYNGPTGLRSSVRVSGWRNTIGQWYCCQGMAETYLGATEHQLPLLVETMSVFQPCRRVNYHFISTHSSGDNEQHSLVLHTLLSRPWDSNHTCTAMYFMSLPIVVRLSWDRNLFWAYAGWMSRLKRSFRYTIPWQCGYVAIIPGVLGPLWYG